MKKNRSDNIFHLNPIFKIQHSSTPALSPTPKSCKASMSKHLPLTEIWQHQKQKQIKIFSISTGKM